MNHNELHMKEKANNLFFWVLQCVYGDGTGQISCYPHTNGPKHSKKDLQKSVALVYRPSYKR